MENDSQESNRPRIASRALLVSDAEFSQINPFHVHITVDIQRKMNPQIFEAIMQSTSFRQFITRVVFVYLNAIMPEESYHLRETGQLTSIYTMAIEYFSRHQMLSTDELGRLTRKMQYLLIQYIHSRRESTVTR